MIKYKQVRYDLIGAHFSHVNKNPYVDMRELGFKIIASVPQTIGDQIWFTVENYIDKMPSYISKMEYNYDYWHGECWANCKYFKINHSCCGGGTHCLCNGSEEE